MHCSTIQLWKTEDEVLDIFKQFCVHAGKRGILISDKKWENNSYFQRYYRNQSIRFENSAR